MTRIGTYIVKDPDLSLETRVQVIKEAGFDFICAGSIAQLLGGDEPSLTMLAEKNGLPIANIHLSGAHTNAMWLEGTLGEDVMKRYLNEISTAAQRNIKVGIVHATWGIDNTPPVTPLGLSRYRQIAEHAEKAGFTVAIENSVSAKHVHAVLDTFNVPSVGHCFDSGHWNAFAPEENYLSAYGDRLVATHMQDNDGWRDLHICPMDGCTPFDKVRTQLKGTPLGARELTAETAGRILRKCPGQTAADIRQDLHRVSALQNEELLHIEDGWFSVYANLDYEAYIARLVTAMRYLADESTQG